MSRPVAAVTGASTGIGREIALELARRGYDVATFSRRTAATAELAALGARTEAFPCDVRDREKVLSAFAAARERLGRIDLLVANAGVGFRVPAKRYDGSIVAQVIETNVLGAVYAIEAVLPDMLERGSGKIAGISSLASWLSFPVHGSYAASKAALSAILSGLRIELAPKGISVTTVCPGFIRTDMTAPNRFRMPMLMDADVAARKIVTAIVKGRRVHAFPWPMALAVRCGRLLPTGVWEWMARGSPRA